MMIKKAFITIVSFLIFQFAFANDTYFALVGGTLIPQSEKDISVEMKEEVITINCQNSFYEVTVDFTFYNHGDTVNLVVGFPFFVPGITNQPAKIFGFKCWTDGIETSFEDLPIIRSFDLDKKYELENAYARTVSFEKGKFTTTKISYKATYPGGMGGYETASYLYGTGSSWKNSIGKITLRIINNLNNLFLSSITMGSVQGKGEYSEVKNKFIKKNDNTFEAVFYDIEPDYKNVFTIWFEDILNDVGPKRFPAHFLYNKKIAAPDDLLWYRKDQLRIVRNAIYAIHGYSFKSKDLQDFFNYRGTEWRPSYQERINKGFSESEMTDIEKKNIEIILAEEKRR